LNGRPSGIYKERGKTQTKYSGEWPAREKKNQPGKKNVSREECQQKKSLVGVLVSRREKKFWRYGTLRRRKGGKGNGAGGNQNPGQEGRRLERASRGKDPTVRKTGASWEKVNLEQLRRGDI